MESPVPHEYAYSYGIGGIPLNTPPQLVIILHGTSFVAHFLTIRRHCSHYWPNGAPSALGELNMYTVSPVLSEWIFAHIGWCVCGGQVISEMCPGFFLASVLFVVFAQGLDSGLALPSAVPFYASPRTFAAGRRRQAFTFGICMSCMNFLQCHSEWARSPDSPFSPPKSLLCLFISAEIWASYKIYACGFYELIPVPHSVVFYGSLRPWRTGEKTPNN